MYDDDDRRAYDAITPTKDLSCIWIPTGHRFKHEDISYKEIYRTATSPLHAENAKFGRFRRFV